jgi:hypothetical protein
MFYLRFWLSLLKLGYCTSSRKTLQIGDKSMKICAIMRSTEQDGYKKRKLSDGNPGKSRRQTRFLTSMAKVGA